MALVSVATAQARSLLNDVLATTWTDAVLLPLVGIAHQELQTALWKVGSPVVREVSDLITVGVGDTDLGTNQPDDLLAPTKLYEYTSAGLYVGEMTEVFYIPEDVTQTTQLRYWAWRKEVIEFLGATAITKVKIRYRRLITVPVLVGDDIGITFGEMYIGPRIAALAAGSVGNKDVMEAATAIAKANFGEVLAANRGQQTPPNKP